MDSAAAVWRLTCASVVSDLRSSRRISVSGSPSSYVRTSRRIRSMLRFVKQFKGFKDVRG